MFSSLSTCHNCDCCCLCVYRCLFWPEYVLLPAQVPLGAATATALVKAIFPISWYSIYLLHFSFFFGFGFGSLTATLWLWLRFDCGAALQANVCHLLHGNSTQNLATEKSLRRNLLLVLKFDFGFTLRTYK